MIQKIMFMNGYGVFVWFSFAITFVSCAIIYIKTLRTLKKYENEFAKELNKLSVSERKIVLKKSKVASQVFASYNKSF
ncbi:MAG: heme exporter protein CcmD [Candidatus Pelagibacter sp. TMED263]|nr:MAG: heme exporter protein CcmD [Candidatus Pelagibacter sp. TMED263]|tara:strand:+ start:45 stop:278 length:234 start_codon:yes stop_codon:yes gene_type:complete